MAKNDEVIIVNSLPGSGEDTDDYCTEINIILSDMHLSEGVLTKFPQEIPLRTSVWRFMKKFVTEVEPLPLVEQQNPLEDFPRDDIFVDFLTRIREKYCKKDGEKVSPKVYLRLLGDIFDPVAVRLNGVFVEARHEEENVEKMNIIIDGHPDYFDALADFVREDNTVIDFFLGNHDVFIAWPGVQDVIRTRIAGDDEELRNRIRFMDQHTDFGDVHKRVMYVHGMNAEASTSVNPKDVIIRSWLGVDLKRPVLNVPLGHYMVLHIVNQIKVGNKFVGRLVGPGGVWTNAALHRWGWSLYCGVILAYVLLYKQFFGFWNFRRHANWRTMIDTITGTMMMSDSRTDTYARRKLREHEDDIDVVVVGHSHEARKEYVDGKQYINTGSWSVMYQFVYHKFNLVWKRFRWIERMWRPLVHFMETGKLYSSSKVTGFIGFVALVAAMITFLAMSFPNNWALGFLHVSDLKIPIGIMLVFVILSAFIRVFAVPPQVEQVMKLTFARVSHYKSGDKKGELMEYLPIQKEIREIG